MIRKIFNNIFKNNKDSSKSYLLSLKEQGILKFDEGSILNGLFLENRGTIKRECLSIGKQSSVSGNFLGDFVPP